MADTTRGWWPEEKCDDCGEKGVMFKHWGFITGGKLKNLCGRCMGKRSDEFYGTSKVKGEKDGEKDPAQ